MMEVVERLLSEDDESPPKAVRFSYSRPEHPWLNRTVIRIIERLSGQARLEYLYRQWAANPAPASLLMATG